MMVLTMTSWPVSGRPCQFVVMGEASRCSILFYLEVRMLCSSSPTSSTATSKEIAEIISISSSPQR